MALSKLGELGVPIISEDAERTMGRCVKFHTGDGSVYMRQI